jgi:membrane fusion protein, multidrug efflux system
LALFRIGGLLINRVQNSPIRRWSEDRSQPRLAEMLALALSTALVVCGCKDSNSASKSASSPPPVPVVVAKAERKSIPLTLTVIGNVEPIQTVAIKSRIDGEIVAVRVRDGQQVAKGELLFELDKRYFEAQLKQNQANEAKNRALLRNARSLETRYATLLSKGFISDEAYTQARTSREAAEATLAADHAAVETAQVQLSYTKIWAPIAGRAGRVMVPLGNTVKVTDQQPLVVLNQMAPIYVSFAVPERYLDQIRDFSGKSALAVEASPRGSTGAPAKGTLAFFDNAVDNQTGTIRLRAAFPNADDRLWPGQFVSATLTLREDQAAIVIPSQAIQNGPKGQYVFVVKPDSSAEIREIKIERAQGDLSVIEKGLQAGETVVTSGQLRVTGGAKLAPKPG